MKKLLFAVMAVFLAAGMVYASEVNKTLLAATLLDNSPTAITTDAINVQNFTKVGFWVSYDETQVGNTVSGAVTLTVSYDGTNYVSGSFLDVAGGATPQTSETLSSDGWYFFWLDASWPYKYAKVTVTGTNTDADDTISTAVYVVGMK